MVVIRLARGGNRNRPYFYIVVADSRARRDGRFIEKLGFHNPIAGAKSEAFRVKMDRVEYWTSVGAQLSSAVEKLIKANAIKSTVSVA